MGQPIPMQDKQICVAWFRIRDGSSRLIPMMPRMIKNKITANGAIRRVCPAEGFC